MCHPTLSHLFLTLELANMQIIALGYNLRYAAVLFGYGIGHIYLHLHPVGTLAQPEAFHVLRIVGIVVDGGHGRELVKALHKHTLSVHVGKAKGAFYLGHAALLAPLFYGVDKGCAHLHVVNKVYPAKAHRLAVPRLVGTTVDNGSHAAHYFTIAQSQKVVGFTKLEGGILLG